MSAASADPATVGGDLDGLARRLGHHFADRELLVEAVRHGSWCSENGGVPSNERLEFLGDAVLGLAVADHAFSARPARSEGALAKIRASVVNATALAELAAELGIGEHLLLGRGEDAAGGRQRPSILADTFEALLGAIYLDGGWEAARRVVVDLFDDRIAAAASSPGIADHKTRLQEIAARRFGATVDYEVTDEGPDHAKTFRAVVRVGDEVTGTGTGRTKKQAQQAAAGEAWHRLVGREGDDDA